MGRPCRPLLKIIFMSAWALGKDILHKIIAVLLALDLTIIWKMGLHICDDCTGVIDSINSEKLYFRMGATRSKKELFSFLVGRGRIRVTFSVARSGDFF